MLLQQIAREIQFFFLPIMYMKKITKIQDRQILTVYIQAICTLHLCYDFAFMLHENALLFSPSEMHQFY